MSYLANKLSQLGLSDYESRILAVLVESSPTSATHIAKKCSLSRSSVYTTLSTLITKGLVGTTYKNEVKQFIFAGLESIEKLLKEQQKELKERKKIFKEVKTNVADIERLQLNVPQATFFEGKDGLRKIYLSMMWEAPKNSTMRIIRDEFIWSKEWEFVFEDYWRKVVKNMKVTRNVSTKLLVNDSKIEHDHKAFYKKVKSFQHAYLPKAHSVNNFAMYIVGDIMSIMSMENNNLVGIKITNASLAENHKELFESLWSSSTKTKGK